jgi:hypothetical protein
LFIGLVSAVAAVSSGAGAVAATTGAIPRPGDWEGMGPRGLPISFELVRRHGHLVATALAAGYPASCPAVKRDAAAVPLVNPAYAGPGSGAVPVGAQAALSGRIPRSARLAILRGHFSSVGTGTFSVPIRKKLGCGWPGRTVTWIVHRATRVRIGDGTWTGPLTSPGLINGNVRLVVGARGRAIDSFTSFFTCITDTQQGNTNFRAVPAFEFIRPGGSFYSPLNGGLVRGHRTTWSGKFSPAGGLSGTLTIFDDCTGKLVRAHFSATRTKPA